MENKLTINHVLVIIALCFSTVASVGIVTNTAGLYFTPVSQALNTGRGSVSLTASLCNLTFAVGGFILTRYSNRNNFKKLIIINCTITVIATLLLSFANSLYQLYILNALRGVSTGIVGSILATTLVNNWFNENTATFTSIVLSCSGIGSAVFSPMFSKVIANIGWRGSYRVSALLIAIFYLPIILFKVAIKPEDIDLKPYGASKNKAETKDGEKTPFRIILLLALYASLSGFMTGVVQHFPGVAESFGLSVGAAMLSAAMITNSLSKIILGALIDRLGVIISDLIMCLIVAIGIILLVFVHVDGIYIAAAAIFGFAYSLCTIGQSMLTRHLVAPVNFAKDYSSIAIFTTVSYATSTTLIGYIYDFTGSYLPVFIILAFFLTMMVVIILTVQKQAQK